MPNIKSRIAVAAILVSLCPLAGASAHGFAGDRFFPATLLTDDPFVADEMSLPTATVNPAGTDGSRETDLEFDISKRLTPDLGLTFEDQWKYIHQKNAPTLTGFDAIDTGVQYQLFVNGPHEFMALAGVDVSWAKTGSERVGAPNFTTVSPGFDFGKGFGDLPDALTWLKPLAITSNLSVDFPTQTGTNGNQNPNNFNYGFAIEYSLEYLQHHVRDIGLTAPFDRVIPLVEIAMTTPLNRGQTGQTTGTVQPGFIWAGQYYQIGTEMIIPVNSLSGRGIGGLVQLHFFLDDLFPNSIGKPLLSF